LDLGTDKCCISYQDNIGRPFIITDDNSYKISSIIGLMNNGILVGNEISKNNMYDIPIISNLKRLIGRKANDKEVIQIASYFNWKIEDEKNDLILSIEDKKHSLNDLMCILLKKIKNIIISNIGDNFNVIITIPAIFNEEQKNTTIKVTDVAGRVIRNYELGIRNEKSVTLDMSGYAKGVYFVEVKTEKGRVNRKMIKN